MWEYLIGLWLVGAVLTSLFIVATLISRKTWTVAKMNKLEMFLMAVFTCLVWPVFWGYTLYSKWCDLKVL